MAGNHSLHWYIYMCTSTSVHVHWPQYDMLLLCNQVQGCTSTIEHCLKSSYLLRCKSNIWTIATIKFSCVPSYGNYMPSQRWGLHISGFWFLSICAEQSWGRFCSLLWCQIRCRQFWNVIINFIYANSHAVLTVKRCNSRGTAFSHPSWVHCCHLKQMFLHEALLIDCCMLLTHWWLMRYPWINTNILKAELIRS